MRKITVRNLSRENTAPIQAAYADSFLTQLRGLTFRRSIAPQEGLILVQKRDSRIDSSIHMLAVFTDLAVVWINSQYEVVDVRLARSWRPAYFPAGPARYVLEMNPARLDDFRPGDRLQFDGV
jgi:uncharacterized membrane protein (UPF0127 family)